MGMSGGKFSKPWQVTDKLLSDFLFTIHIFILRMDQTQEIITLGIQKFMNEYEGMCMSGESFLRNDKWEIKLLSEFFFN